jgi:hypothetical protein
MWTTRKPYIKVLYQRTVSRIFLGVLIEIIGELNAICNDIVSLNIVFIGTAWTRGIQRELETFDWIYGLAFAQVVN